MGSTRKTHADPTTLDVDAYNLALHCVDTIVRFRAYTSGGLLVMLLGKFRDDVREAHFKKPMSLPTERGSQYLPLDELTSSELAALSGAVGTLLDQFANYMDDPSLPELLTDFQDALNLQAAEREKIRAEMTPDGAEAS